MTNGSMLAKIIKESGHTQEEFAELLGITRQGLYKKLCNKSEFRVSEMEKAAEFLKLTDKQKTQIFFAKDVGK